MYKLPYFLKPKITCKLQRVGSQNDGGYVIPAQSLKETDTLISFGLSDNWSFEKEFQKISGAKVMCFDNSVNIRFWLIRFIKNLIFILLFKNLYENLKKLTTFFDYLLFFNNKNIIHLKKFIAPKNNIIFGINQKDQTDLNEILKEISNQNIFLKIDIEGNEYKILDQIIKHQGKLNGLVIEFHNCDLHFERIKNFINNLNLDLAHIHVNNYSNINNLLNPDVIELSFCKKDYSYKSVSKEKKFPIKNLDSPNNKEKDDAQVLFY